MNSDLQQELFLYIDAIYIINLESRKDRKEFMEKQMEKLGISQYTFFKAICPDEKTMKKYKHFLKKSEEYYRIGSLGCLLSHLEIIKIAKKCSYKNILILEDDCEFMENIEKIILYFKLFYSNNYAIGYLSGSHMEKPDFISDNIVKVKKTYTTTSYIINHSIFNYIINNLENYNQEIDKFYALEIQTKYNCYCSFPHLTRQKEGYSDIHKQFVNYKCENPHK